MKRLLLAAALIALPCAALSAPRPLNEPISTRGVFTVRYAVANGYDGREVTAAEYEAFVRDGSCMPNSHTTTWPASHEVTLVCEL